MKKFLLVLLFTLSLLKAEEVCSILNGSKIIAQDSENTYLGEIKNKYSSDSIFNDYGNYGGEYSSTSIWNQYSTLGNKYSSYSPFNKYTSTPPMIIKNGKVIGYLSSNEGIKPSISPNLLKALCEDNLYWF